MNMNTVKKVLGELRAHANPKNVEGMAKFGISSKNTLGVPMPVIRTLGKELGNDHALAIALWKSGVHEARILAGLVEQPEQITPNQMDRWVKDFDSWDVCDQVCLNLFSETPFAHQKALQWSKDNREFVKRAGFALMACLAVHDKRATENQFEKFFPAILHGAVDERNFVKKAVNWALRQIGKRNTSLSRKAIRIAGRIQKMNSKSARWIATDALRELRSSPVQRRLKK